MVRRQQRTLADERSRIGRGTYLGSSPRAGRGTRFLHEFLVRTFGHEHCSTAHHVCVDAFVEPALAHHALPLEILGEIGIGERVGIFQIDIESVVKRLIRIREFGIARVMQIGIHDCGNGLIG